MFGLGTTEILIVLVIALLVFGPAKLPEIGRQIGGLMREMRRMSDDVRRTLDVDDYHYNRNDYRYENSHQGEPEAISSAQDYEPTPSYHDDAEGDTAAAGANGAVSRGTAVYDGARPWSIQDDTAAEEPDYADYSYSGEDAPEEITAETPQAGREPVTMAEPPGPPHHQKEL